VKIFVNATTTEDLTGSVNSSHLALSLAYYFDNGTVGGEAVVFIPWSTLSTATTLNAAIKTAAVSLIAQQNGYTFNSLTDQMFLLAGFVGL
jgi:hypothetical protein